MKKLAIILILVTIVALGFWVIKREKPEPIPETVPATGESSFTTPAN